MVANFTFYFNSVLFVFEILENVKEKNDERSFILKCYLQNVFMNLIYLIYVFNQNLILNKLEALVKLLDYKVISIFLKYLIYLNDIKIFATPCI